MSRNLVRRAISTLGVLIALAVPATAQAWTVTVHIHGAGKVDDIDRGAGFDCTVTTTGKSNTSVTDCVLGSPGGVYNSFDIVQLRALVPQTHFDRGWRFSHWVDSTAGGGKVNCDPTGGAGQPPATDCKFQIFENLEVDLYFVDQTGPQSTVVNSGPSTPTKQTSASFTFGSEDPDAGYECRLEKPDATIDWHDCGTTLDKSESFSNLNANGLYTFRVRGKDPSGNVDPTPSVWTWTVDTVAPTATISGNPAHNARTNDDTPNLSASASDGTLVCRFDGIAVPCNFTAQLPDGTYTFSATATDAAGNAHTAARTFTIDTVAPVITFTSGPAEGSTDNDTSPGFAWTANEGGSAFTCALDDESDEAFGPCATLTGLSDGPHTLRVRMTDHAGNTATARRTWRIDTTGPETTLLSGPAEGSTSASTGATFEFASPESGTSFECSLDGAAFAACASPLTLTGLPEGDHVFEVRARDATGNADATPARRAWRVNTLDADGDGVNRPADCDDTNAAIRPGATDTPGDAIDQDCVGGPEPIAPGNVGPATGGGGPATGGGQPAADAPALLSRKFRPGRRSTRIVRLALSRVAVGATVKLACRGRGCPFRSRTYRPATGTVDVRRALKRRALRAGTRLTLTVVRPGQTTQVFRLKFRRGKSPVVS